MRKINTRQRQRPIDYCDLWADFLGFYNQGLAEYRLGKKEKNVSLVLCGLRSCENLTKQAIQTLKESRAFTTDAKLQSLAGEARRNLWDCETERKDLEMRSGVKPEVPSLLRAAANKVIHSHADASVLGVFQDGRVPKAILDILTQTVDETL
jgi:hypothetical protein